MITYVCTMCSEDRDDDLPRCPSCLWDEREEVTDEEAERRRALVGDEEDDSPIIESAGD